MPQTKLSKAFAAKRENTLFGYWASALQKNVNNITACIMLNINLAFTANAQCT